MQIERQTDDDPEFIVLVERVVNGILRRCAPESLALVKIDNWFGARWLGFAGKVIGAFGLTTIPSYHDRKHLRIPPFVPDRVVSQRRFAGPEFGEIDTGKPVHKHIPSRRALQRLAADDESNVALAWFSGNTKTNDRGALMMYIPADNFYWAWYAELQRGKSWRITKAWEIKREDLAALMEERSDSLVEASFAAIQDSRRSKISAQIALVPRG